MNHNKLCLCSTFPPSIVLKMADLKLMFGFGFPFNMFAISEVIAVKLYKRTISSLRFYLVRKYLSEVDTL